MTRTRYINGSNVTDHTSDKTSNVADFSIKSSMYAGLLLRYMSQFQMVKRTDMYTNVLDLGAANCCAAHLYASKAMQHIGREAINYTGVEIDPNIKQQPEPDASCIIGFELIIADLVEEWTWAKDRTWDVVWYTSCIEHVPYEKALYTLQQARRVCPDGKMFLATPAPLYGSRVWPDSHDHEFTREEMRELITEAGWEIEDEWGQYRDLRKDKWRAPEYKILANRIGSGFAKAVCSALYPEHSEELSWICK